MSSNKEQRSTSQELCNRLYGDHLEQTRVLVGRVLTVIDACMADPVQRKATKDLLERILWEHNGDAERTFTRYCNDLAEVIKEAPIISKCQSGTSNSLI